MKVLPLPCQLLDLRMAWMSLCKMAVPSPEGDEKIVSPIITFSAKYVDT